MVISKTIQDMAKIIHQQNKENELKQKRLVLKYTMEQNNEENKFKQIQTKPNTDQKNTFEEKVDWV